MCITFSWSSVSTWGACHIHTLVKDIVIKTRKLYLILYTKTHMKERKINNGFLGSYLQSKYFLLHGHNPTITPNSHSCELLDLNAYKYEPYTKRNSQNYCKRKKVCNIQISIEMELRFNPSTISDYKFDLHGQLSKWNYWKTIIWYKFKSWNFTCSTLCGRKKICMHDMGQKLAKDVNWCKQADMPTVTDMSTYLIH